MDFSIENRRDREFYAKDFSRMNILLNRIRECFVHDKNLHITDLNLSGLFDFDNKIAYTYITLFQEGLKPIRYGTLKSTLEETLNRDISQIKQNKMYKEFNVADSKKCRIMIEYLTEQKKVDLKSIVSSSFVPERFEPGITGIRIILDNKVFIYTPTQAWTESQMDLKSALNTILRKTYIKNLTNKISERIAILKEKIQECYIVKSRAFVTYENNTIPLYRGNILYEYSPELIKEQALSGADWTLLNQKENGQFLYYYDAKDDNYKDHEHPLRKEDDLYYNDLRHCGGIVTLIRAYQLTGDKKYLTAAKKGLDFITGITKEHIVDGRPAAYVYYNKKAKLGGTGMILVAMMKYRIETMDKSYDELIKKYVIHILSRIYKTGEMLGYYIHPSYNDGNPLIDMTDQERRATFSFYYPGEALLGLALFANYFNDDKELKTEVISKSKIALDWIVNERPKIYADLFTPLPSDAWLMQAIEEWVLNPEMKKQNLINFVFNDAKKMMERTYKKDDSPYIDYEGGYYYNYGDHFYPDGSRSEGLIAAYYLAKYVGENNLACDILEACRKTAKSQFILFNNEKNVYAHKNPQKSAGSIRFKATRQWVRVDSIQHVACFYFRLFFAETGKQVS